LVWSDPRGGEQNVWESVASGGLRSKRGIKRFEKKSSGGKNQVLRGKQNLLKQSHTGPVSLIRGLRNSDSGSQGKRGGGEKKNKYCIARNAGNEGGTDCANLEKV